MRYIKIDENNKVISVRQGAEIAPGEIQSELGECGQIMQANGTFITPPQPEPEPDPIEMQLTQLQENVIILMDALATLYEEILMMREGGTV